MGNQFEGIRSVDVEKGDKGEVRKVRILFGPHHFLELHASGNGKVDFLLGATHHGFRADASSVPSELERITEEVRRLFPANTID